MYVHRQTCMSCMYVLMYVYVYVYMNVCRQTSRYEYLGMSEEMLRSTQSADYSDSHSHMTAFPRKRW